MKTTGCITVSLIVCLVSLVTIGCYNNPGGGITPTPPPTPDATASIATETPETLPDLQITNIDVSPDPIYSANQPAVLLSGQTYQFVVEVVNKGPGNVPGNVLIRIDYTCSSECSEGVLGQNNLTAFVGEVGINEATQSQPTEVKPDARGIYTFSFEVDPDNIYPETDESDNSNIWETTIIVQ